MENENAYANHGIIIMIAYVNGVKLYRVYKEGNIRAEVTEESEAKRIADVLKYEKWKIQKSMNREFWKASFRSLAKTQTLKMNLTQSSRGNLNLHSGNDSTLYG